MILYFWNLVQHLGAKYHASKQWEEGNQFERSRYIVWWFILWNVKIFAFFKKITEKSFGDRSFWRESIHVVSKCQSQLDNVNQSKSENYSNDSENQYCRLILGIGCITYHRSQFSPKWTTLVVENFAFNDLVEWLSAYIYIEL